MISKYKALGNYYFSETFITHISKMCNVTMIKYLSKLLKSNVSKTEQYNWLFCEIIKAIPVACLATASHCLLRSLSAYIQQKWDLNRLRSNVKAGVVRGCHEQVDGLCVRCLHIFTSAYTLIAVGVYVNVSDTRTPVIDH